MAKFRFQDLKIWQKAMDIADKLFDIADELERKKIISICRSDSRFGTQYVK